MPESIRSWSVLVAASAVAGCSTSPPGAPQDRALYRLRTSAVAPVVSIQTVPEEPSGPSVPAYTVELRFLGADGKSLLAPRITAFPGQRVNVQAIRQLSFIQDFDVDRKGDEWIADPVIGVLQSGWAVDLVILDAPETPDEAALAFHVRASDVRRPIPTRTIDAISPRVASPITIQLPRCESASVVGARRLRIDDEVEIASLPDPAGSGEVALLGRVVRTEAPAPSDGLSWRTVEDAGDDAADARLATLRALGDAAAKGSPSGSLRVTALRLPPGVEDPEARGVERLATLAFASILDAGAAVSQRLSEAYLRDWDLERAHGGGPCDPVIGTHESGLTVVVAEGGVLRVAWTTTPAFRTHSFAPFAIAGTGAVTSALPSDRDAAFRLSADVPDAQASERSLPLVAGRSVVPVFRLPDGGTAALVVEFDPAQ